MGELPEPHNPIETEPFINEPLQPPKGVDPKAVSKAPTPAAATQASKPAQPAAAASNNAGMLHRASSSLPYPFLIPCA